MAEQDRADEADRVGLEDVGGHSGAIADIVAHVIGDGGGIARIILVEVALDLADEIGADVGRLCINAAAQPGENGDERRAEGEADEAFDGLVLVEVYLTATL